jgi:hypothetical protein
MPELQSSKISMDRQVDLDSALNFVAGRVEEQADLSGEALTSKQHPLLKYMPSSPLGGWDPEMPVLVPRNPDFERVCQLARAAYAHDRQVNPTSLDWEFAFAVFTLNRHPMWGLLQAASVKRPRSLRDFLLLIVTALVIVVIPLLLASKEGSVQMVGNVIGCATIALLTYFASRRIDNRRLVREIERCRLSSRVAGTTAG